MMKRFDEWEEMVDCNDCEYYWDNTCDGVQKAQERSCTSFKATRSVVIPQKLNALETRLKWLTRALVGVVAITILTGITILILR